jgi:hypothetical protein
MARAGSETLQLETGAAPVLVCWTVPIGCDTETEGGIAAHQVQFLLLLFIFQYTMICVMRC